MRPVFLPSIFFKMNIRVQGGRLITSTYFKDTDRNGYIWMDSCHHESWHWSVPMSQFLRLKRNCSLPDDYLREAELVKACFLQKGYTANDLKLFIANVGSRKREELLKPKVKNNTFDFSAHSSFFTTYSNQHFSMTKY